VSHTHLLLLSDLYLYYQIYYHDYLIHSLSYYSTSYSHPLAQIIISILSFGIMAIITSILLPSLSHDISISILISFIAQPIPISSLNQLTILY